MSCASYIAIIRDNEAFLFGELGYTFRQTLEGFPVAQMVEHGASNAKIMGSFPRESKSWSSVKL